MHERYEDQGFRHPDRERDWRFERERGAMGSGGGYGGESRERYGRPQPQAAAGWAHHPWNPERSDSHPGLLKRLFGRGPKGYKRTDERIREDICERLIYSDHIDCSDVSVEVKDGNVVLDGTVPERHMKYEIEDIADACPGVKDVENGIRVQRMGAPDSSREVFGYGMPDPQAGTGMSGIDRDPQQDRRYR